MNAEQCTGASRTSDTLLIRLRAQEADAWRRLSELYGPLVYGWARAAGLHEADAADVMQGVFQAVFTSIDRFRKDRPADRFRDWLWTIARRRICDHFRQRQKVPQAVGGSDANLQWQQLPDRFAADEPEAATSDSAVIVRTAMDLVRGEFESRTWQACVLTAIEQRPAAEVAAELGMSLGAVYVARSRVLKRIRQELDGLL